jgi:hypothetical protein
VISPAAGAGARDGQDEFLLIRPPEPPPTWMNLSYHLGRRFAQ